MPGNRTVGVSPGLAESMNLSGLRLVIVLAGVLAAAGGCHNFKALPEGISHVGSPRTASDAVFLIDNTWLDEAGDRHVDQQIFDEAFRIIAEAYEFVLVDMFLFNDSQGPVPETTRALAEELTDALVAKKFSRPGMDIVLITDPVNTVYGGRVSPHLERLRHAGVRVVVTDLDQLRDSNAVYSFFWRIFFKPFGNAEAGTLPNPIGPGRVSLRSYLALVNFKANHRKVLIADSNDGYVGLVSSANPHDGSSAHRNAAVRFNGSAALDLLATENAVLAMSGQEPVTAAGAGGTDGNGKGLTVQVVTEGQIKRAILERLERARTGDSLDLMMFYLSDREVIAALKNAQERGAVLRVLLDPNKDAFGREKNGVPNRPVGYELHSAGLPVRWCATRGEQCHSKLLLVNAADGKREIITGSANFTRRNLTDFNLETNVIVAGDDTDQVLTDAQAFFDASWSNSDDRRYSMDYESYEDRSWLRRQLYRFMEWSGVSSF